MTLSCRGWLVDSSASPIGGIKQPAEDTLSEKSEEE